MKVETFSSRSKTLTENTVSVTIYSNTNNCCGLKILSDFGEFNIDTKSEYKDDLIYFIDVLKYLLDEVSINYEDIYGSE